MTTSLKRFIMAVGAFLALNTLVFAAPISPPAGNYLLNVSTTASKPAANISSATIRDQLSLPFLTAGQCTTTDSSGKVINTACGSGGGVTVYPASATATFPYGIVTTTVTASSATVTRIIVSTITFSPTKTGQILDADGSNLLAYDDYSTFLGYQTSALDTKPGSFRLNTCFGALCMKAATPNSGGFPVAETGVGYKALTSDNGGTGNTAIGAQAMKTLTSGINNTSVGSSSLFSDSSGNGNTAIGGGSLVLVSLSSNTGVGFDALSELTTGMLNTAIGYEAGNSTDNLTGSSFSGNRFGQNNTYLGAYTGQGPLYTTAIDNSIAIGFKALIDASNQAQIGGRPGTGNEVNLRVSSITLESGIRTPAFNATFTSMTVTGSAGLLVSNLTSGQCVQTGTGGLLTVTGSGCGSGGGGSSTLEVFSGATRSSPTASIGLNPSDFSSLVTGSTFYLALNPATTDFIHNQTTAQTATFNVSSGTVTNFTSAASTITALTADAINVTGAGAGKFAFLEGTAPSGVTSKDILWADSTANWLKFLPNNTSTYTVVGTSNAVTVGNCAKFGANGSLLDAGAACGTGSSSGGSSTLEVFSGSTRSSPTASISLNSSDFSSSVTGSTFTFSLNPATTDFIHNQTTVQTAAFNVTSGTVNTLTVSSNTILPGTTFYQNGNIQTSLTASLPVKTNAQSVLTAAAVDLSGAEATGIMAAGRFPALTGDITTSAGNLATTMATTISGVKTWTGSSTVTNAGGLNVTYGSIVGSMTVSNLASGQCVQTGTAGLLTVTGSACGTGSGSGSSFTLVATTGGPNSYSSTPISSNTTTTTILFDSATTNGRLLAGSTYFLTLNGSSVTLQGNSITFAMVGTATGTLANQFPVSFSTNTTGTVDISAQTNLAASGNANLSNDTLNVGLISLSTGITGTLDISANTNLAASGNANLSNDTINVGLISLSTGVTGILPAANMASTVAFLTSTQSWTAGQTFISSVTVTSTFTVTGGSTTIFGPMNIVGVSSYTIASVYFDVGTSTSNIGRTYLNGVPGSSGTVMTSGGTGGMPYWSTVSASGGDGTGYAVEPATVTFNLAKGLQVSTISANAFNSTVTSITVTASGGLNVNRQSYMTSTVIGNTTLTSTMSVVLASSTFSSVTGSTITLPAASSNPGMVITISKVDTTTGPVKILGAGSDLISGTGTVNINAFMQTVSIMSDGISNWIPFGQGIQVTPPAFPISLNTAGTPAMAASSNTVICPFYAPIPVSVMGYRYTGVAMGASKISFGLYDQNGVLLTSTGPVAGANNNQSVLATPYNLPPGQYYAGVQINTTAGQITGGNDGAALLQLCSVKTATSMVMPNPFTFGTAATKYFYFQVLVAGGRTGE